METATAFKTMARNNAWANVTLYAATSGLGQNAFIAQAPGFFPSLSATLNHIYEVDLYYLDALEAGGRGRSVYDRDDVTDAKQLGEHQAEADKRLILFCDALSADTLDDMRKTQRPDGIVDESVGALLLHLFQHQIHHRGQAHVQLQSLGIAPPQLDDFHLNFGRASTAARYWP